MTGEINRHDSQAGDLLDWLRVVIIASEKINGT